MTLKRDWLESKEYKAQLADLKRVHSISENIRETNPEFRRRDDEAWAVYDLVQLEMNFAGGNLDLSIQIAQLAYMWGKERDPYYMDKAQLICASRNVELPPTLYKLNIEATLKRYFVGYGALKSTSDSIEREVKIAQALTLMANLIYYGDAISLAANKASQWFLVSSPKVAGKPLNGSTLRKYYKARICNTGLEKVFFNSWNRSINEEIRSQWKSLSAELPEVEDSLKCTYR